MHIIVCSCALAGLIVAGPASSGRAFWADGFNAAFYTPEQVDTLISRLKESNCNPSGRRCERAATRTTNNHEPWAKTITF